MSVIRMQSIAVKHNIEVAHRLFELPGKCEQIHGHSMWVTMELFGPKNNRGILGGIEYGDLKKMFRGHLDEEYDHRLLLNRDDPYAQPIFMATQVTEERVEWGEQHFLPGLNPMPGDPTTENISEWVAQEMESQLFLMGHKDLFRMEVTVWETSVNMAKTEIGLERGVYLPKNEISERFEPR